MNSHDSAHDAPRSLSLSSMPPHLLQEIAARWLGPLQTHQLQSACQWLYTCVRSTKTAVTFVLTGADLLGPEGCSLLACMGAGEGGGGGSGFGGGGAPSAVRAFLRVMDPRTTPLLRELRLVVDNRGTADCRAPLLRLVRCLEAGRLRFLELKCAGGVNTKIKPQLLRAVCAACPALTGLALVDEHDHRSWTRPPGTEEEWVGALGELPRSLASLQFSFMWAEFSCALDRADWARLPQLRRLVLDLWRLPARMLQRVCPGLTHLSLHQPLSAPPRQEKSYDRTGALAPTLASASGLQSLSLTVLSGVPPATLRSLAGLTGLRELDVNMYGRGSFGDDLGAWVAALAALTQVTRLGLCVASLGVICRVLEEEEDGGPAPLLPSVRILRAKCESWGGLHWLFLSPRPCVDPATCHLQLWGGCDFSRFHLPQVAEALAAWPSGFSLEPVLAASLFWQQQLQQQRPPRQGYLRLVQDGYASPATLEGVAVGLQPLAPLLRGLDMRLLFSSTVRKLLRAESPGRSVLNLHTLLLPVFIPGLRHWQADAGVLEAFHDAFQRGSLGQVRSLRLGVQHGHMDEKADAYRAVEQHVLTPWLGSQRDGGRRLAVVGTDIECARFRSSGTFRSVLAHITGLGIDPDGVFAVEEEPRVMVEGRSW